MILLDRVTKDYAGHVRANDGISLDVRPGEVLGLLGPNGAGKTTLVNQLLGLLRPTSGRVFVGGVDVVAHPAAARRLCSVQPQAQTPITGLTMRRAIELVGRLRGGARGEVRRRTAEIASALELDEWLDVPSARLSGGARRLTSFAMAAIAPGAVVVLDEPTNDVDPVRRRLLWDHVGRLSASGSAVVLVTHNVAEVERVVTRLAIIDRGRILVDGSPAQLRADDERLRFEIAWRAGVAKPALPPFLCEPSATDRGFVARVEPIALRAAVDWVDACRATGLVDAFWLGAATLEDVYLGQLRGHSAEREGVPTK